MNAASALRVTMRTLAAALPFALAIEALVAWASGLQLVTDAILFIAVGYQILLAIRMRARPSLRADVVGGTFVTGLFAMALPGPVAGVILLPQGLVCVLVGLRLTHEALVRARVARALRSRRPAADDADPAWKRDRASLALTIPALLAGLLLVPLATWVYPFEKPAGDEPPPALTPPDPPASRRLPGSGGSQIPIGSRAPRVDPGNGPPAFDLLAPGDPDPEMQDRVVLEVKPTSGGVSTGPLGPIYLRGVPRTETGGRWYEDLSRLRRIADKDDGRADGWCDLAPRPQPAEELDLAVRQDVVVFSSTGEAALLCPPDTTAVEAKSVRAERHGAVLTAPGRPDRAFDYRVIARIPSRVPFPSATTRFAAPPGTAPRRRVALPLGLEDAARRAFASSGSDLGRARAIVRHLSDTYRYEALDRNLDDAAALEAFARERRGTCVQFAEAGAGMLRSLGVNARVGTGFIASDWDADRRQYIVRARDCHAWIEVEFQGCGWVIFDPTPSGPNDVELQRPAPHISTGDRDGPFAEPPETSPTYIADLMRRVRDLLLPIGQWIAEHPWPFVALLVVAAAAVALAMRHRNRVLSGETARSAAVRTAWDRLVADLARCGHVRRPAQTASEFAAAVVAAGGGAFAPLVRLTARQQEARFGGRRFTEHDEREIDEFRGRVAALAGAT